MDLGGRLSRKQHSRKITEFRSLQYCHAYKFAKKAEQSLENDLQTPTQLLYFIDATQSVARLHGCQHSPDVTRNIV